MQRLDKALLDLYPDFSRSRIEGLVKAGYVTVNGAVAGKAGMKVSDDDEIVVELPPPVPAVPEPEDIPLSVVFEDDDLVVVDKPPGLVVHPAPGHHSGTLVNALLHHCPNLSGIGGVARPGIVHRLDQDTSGLIVVAKSQAAMDGLVRAFSSHRDIVKTYLAVCHGRPSACSGRLENMIGRHPVDRKRMAILDAPAQLRTSGADVRRGKLALTNWRVLQGLPRQDGSALPLRQDLPISLMECRIETGRTHQIRVHMASIGCPVIGDRTYGRSALDKRLDPVPARQMLHAWRLSLRHPVSGGQLELEAAVPPDMSAYFASSV